MSKTHFTHTLRPRNLVHNKFGYTNFGYHNFTTKFRTFLVCNNQWSTGGRILTGAGEPQFSRGRGWPLKLDRGRGTLNFAGAGGSIPKCSQKLKPEFDNNLENCRNTEYDKTTLMHSWLCNL